MITVETKHFLGVYQAIVESDLGTNQKFRALENLDYVAEKCLTFAEYTQYNKETRDYLNKIVKEV